LVVLENNLLSSVSFPQKNVFNNTHRTKAKRNTGCKKKVSEQRHIGQLLGTTAESQDSVLLSP